MYILSTINFQPVAIDKPRHHAQAWQPRPIVLLLMQSTAAEPRPLDHLQTP